VLKRMPYPIENIQVPAKRIKTLDAAKVEEIAESILDEGQRTPIQLRKSGEKFVLVEGLHRLEALRALGESEVDGYLVQARRH
jgi:sulfiredoxin